MPYAKIDKNKKIKSILLISILSLALIFVSIFGVYLYQKNESDKKLQETQSEERIIIPEGYFNEQSLEYEYTFINDLKGVKIKPKVDFLKDGIKSAEQVSAEIDKLIADVKSLEFNGIILDTKFDDSVIFKSDYLQSTEVDVLKILCEKASKQNISVSVIFNATNIKSNDKILISNHINFNNQTALIDAISSLAVDYPIDSILIDEYYSKRDGEAYAEYVAFGGKDSFSNWILDASNNTLKQMIKAVKLSKNSLPVGIYSDSVWATNKTKEDGLSVNSSFESLTNGNVDVKMLIEEGLVDFINVEAGSSISNKDIPFKTTVDWWGKIAKENKIPMYVTHSGENVTSTTLPGWNGTDELARQVSLSLKSGNYYGSVFTGLSTLIKNPSGSTDILKQYYSNEYSDDDLFKDLIMTSPTKKSFVTYEESVQFRGKFDPNQEVLLNGVKVKVTERGGFSQWVDLKVGKNTITLEHKGKKTVYNVERKVIILKTVSPTKNIRVSGSSLIEFNVMAYKGSNITATINGNKIKLTEGGAGEENAIDSSYVNYQGSYKVPPATNKEQNIGTIKFSGTFQGYSESKNGGSVVIDKLPDTIDPDEATGMILSHATINQRYANTYPYQTAPAYPQGILYQLPYGTTDIVQSVNGSFVNLRSGKTVRAADVTIEDAPFVGNNYISSASVGQENNDTVIRFNMGWKSPFSIEISPYPKEPPNKEYQFRGDTISILLDYAADFDISSLQGDISSSPLFSNITFERIFNESRKIYQQKITLTLSRQGKYYGVHSSWNGDTLTFKFNNPPSSGTLSGVKILVDAGHGGKDNGTMAGRDVLEKEINLITAKKVQAELQALGAEVIMTRYDDTNPSLPTRTAMAHQHEVDMILSCHYNSAGSNQSPSGVETYFNAPFSQPLAKYIQSQLGQYMVDRGVKSSIPNYNFHIAREKQFPSVLIEFGFLSNPNDEQLALDPTHQDNMARGVAQGVLDYYMSY